MFKKLFLSLMITCFAVLPVTGNAESIHKTAQKILVRLYEAHGDQRYSIPKLSVRKTENAGASYRKRTNEIILEEKAYEVCRSFGRDSLQALAFLLGHELAHAYQEVSGSNFLSAHLHDHTGYREEQDADVFGVFVSYQAGFKNYKLLPQILERVYRAYDLIGKKLPGYPSFEDRKATCGEVLKITEQLIQLFDAANFLSVAGKYDLAAKCYEYIETRYKGIEIYNNIGVNYALQALNFTEENTEAFLHPLEIDVNTRLRKQQLDLGGKGLTPQQKRKRADYLNKAAKYFLKAGKLNKAYLAADINLLCVLNIQEAHQKVIDFAQKSLAKHKALSTRGTGQTSAKIRLCLAIAYAGIGESEKARKIFENISREFQNQNIGFLAAYNLKVLNGEGIEDRSDEKDGCSIPFQVPDRVDDARLHRPSFESAVLISAPNDLWVSMIQKENSLVYFFKENGLPSFSLQRVYKSIVLPQQNSENLLPLTVNTSKGYFINCKEERLIFQIRESRQQSSEWVKYFDF